MALGLAGGKRLEGENGTDLEKEEKTAKRKWLSASSNFSVHGRVTTGLSKLDISPSKTCLASVNLHSW